MALTERLAKILEARGLDIELLERLGVAPCAQRGSDWIAIPYVEAGRVVNTKYRTVAGPKRFYQEAGKRKTFWNVDCLTDPTLEGLPLIITEGEFDAMAAMQAGFARVVSVPDGAPEFELGTEQTTKYTYLDNAPKALGDVKEIILAVDSDGPGIALLNDLSLRLCRSRCKWVKYPKGCKDLGDALHAFGERGVVETIARAQWMAVDGVYRMSQLPPLVPAVPHDTGFPGLAKHFRMRPGDFTVITGIPGHGKSTVVNDLACRMAVRHKWPVAFASFEQIPQLDHRRSLRTWCSGGLVKDLTEAEIAKADQWIEESFVFIVPDEDDDVTLPWLFERCAAAVLRYGIKLVVIDPWNEIDHERPPDMTLTEYVGYAIKLFKRFARKHAVHVIVVAHPAKLPRDEGGYLPMPGLYDISDSANWYNRPDAGIVVHRREQDTIVRIAKSRYHDQIGYPGEVKVRYVAERATYEPAN
jgi:twinkle protein